MYRKKNGEKKNNSKWLQNESANLMGAKTADFCVRGISPKQEYLANIACSKWNICATIILRWCDPLNDFITQSILLGGSDYKGNILFCINEIELKF